MNRVLEYCHIQGTRFSPAAAERLLGFCVTDKTEPGDIGKIGRYRGVPKPYGACSIDDSVNPHKDFRSWILDVLEKNVVQFRELGAEFISIHWEIDYHDEDYRLTLDEQFLRRSSQLDIDLTATFNDWEIGDGEYDDDNCDVIVRPRVEVVGSSLLLETVIRILNPISDRFIVSGPELADDPKTALAPRKVVTIAVREITEQFSDGLILLQSLIPFACDLREQGTTLLSFHWDVEYGSTCPLEWHPEFQKALAQLGASFSITCRSRFH